MFCAFAGAPYEWPTIHPLAQINATAFTEMGGGGFSGSECPTLANFRISDLSK
jgi:hypothetical protein